MPDEETPPRATKEGVPRGEGELLLVVDDEPLVRRATARALTGLGYRVIEADSGDQAVSVFSAHADTSAGSSST